VLHRIAMLSKNSIELVLLYFAASKAGIVPVPFNYRLTPAEWSYIVNDAGAKVFIATRFGLINTMVFTHLPANLFLVLTLLMPTFPLTLTMVLLRYCVAQMDVPTRHSYLMAIVAPDERSAAAGVTTVARPAPWRPPSPGPCSALHS
jgi:acyl-CoA synthetase (AMP-forming)/AMP-acid ligase II